VEAVHLEVAVLQVEWASALAETVGSVQADRHSEGLAVVLQVGGVVAAAWAACTQMADVIPGKHLERTKFAPDMMIQDDFVVALERMPEFQPS